MREKTSYTCKRDWREVNIEGKESTFHRLSPSITSTLASQHVPLSLPNTRSTRNENYKGGRRRKTTLYYPKLQNRNETTPKTLHIFNSETPGGVFIATREEGDQGTNPGRKRRVRRDRMAAETRLWPRFRGHRVARRAALRAARCPFYPLSASNAGFWFCAPSFDESALLGQWLFM